VKRPRARVIGLGQPAAGDDGVGLAVLDELRAGGVADDVELVHAPDTTDLVGLLAGTATAVVVDAVLGAHPGEVLLLAADGLAERDACPVSSHGFGVFQALELARIVNDPPLPDVRIVGVTIAPPTHFCSALSAPVAAAVRPAAQRVRELLGG
jgi:hydrogenase maturation protease